MYLESYGLRVFRAGFVLHRDHWPLIRNEDGSLRVLRPGWLARGRRTAIRAFSEGSRRRLEFIAANVAEAFRTIVTLTYHARCEAWEAEGARNLRIVRRTKRDLNRFLTVVRNELGEYLWVQEFQERGVVHYHLLCTGSPQDDRIAMAWCRATGEIDDAAAIRYAVKVEPLRAEIGARAYLGRYLGKGRQKTLPPGVSGAGRWWGRSRGLKFDVLGEAVSRERDGTVRHALEVRVVRSVRRWLKGELGFRPTGGMFVDWGGRLSARLLKVMLKLAVFYAPEWAETVGGRWSFVDTTAERGPAMRARSDYPRRLFLELRMEALEKAERSRTIAGSKGRVGDDDALREIAAVKLRQGASVTRAEAAAYLGVSTRKLQRMESAGTLRRCPNLGTVVRYAARDVLRLASAS